MCVKISSKLPTRLEKLRKEHKLTQEGVAIKIGVTAKTYRTWEKDFEKMKSGIKSVNLIALARLYKVSTDYILGLSNCKNVRNHYISEKMGLDDDAIKALEYLKLQDANEKKNNKIVHIDNGISLVDIMNFTFKWSIENILMSIRDFICVKYKIPVYYDKDKWICPKSDYEFSKGQSGLFPNMWWLNLASNEEMPYDNRSIALTDTFFEAVAIKNIEKQLYDLREIYYDKQE